MTYVPVFGKPRSAPNITTFSGLIVATSNNIRNVASRTRLRRCRSNPGLRESSLGGGPPKLEIGISVIDGSPAHACPIQYIRGNVIRKARAERRWHLVGT